MIRRLRNNRGFTLVELMIVVAIIGILAALAIYGVKKYLTSSKTGEAKQNLGRMIKDAVAAYEKESMDGLLLTAGGTAGAVHRLCGPAAAPLPAAVPKGEKIQIDPEAWNAGTKDTGWMCLKFSVSSPVYYQYNYTQAGTAFSATGESNFDADTTTSGLWVFSGGILNGVARAAPTLTEAPRPEE